MKSILVLALALGTLAVAGCRQEVPYTPMKLGAPAVADQAR